jgi:hypothetical protein
MPEDHFYPVEEFVRFHQVLPWRGREKIMHYYKSVILVHMKKSGFPGWIEYARE